MSHFPLCGIICKPSSVSHPLYMSSTEEGGAWCLSDDPGSYLARCQPFQLLSGNVLSLLASSLLRARFTPTSRYNKVRRPGWAGYRQYIRMEFVRSMEFSLPVQVIVQTEKNTSFHKYESCK